MTPTPEELVKWLRADAKFWGNVFEPDAAKLTAAADLISAQAETLRQMRDALEHIHNIQCSIEVQRVYSLAMLHGEPYKGLTWEKEMYAARHLPISEAERVARENAEKAVLLEAIERNGWTLEYRESLRPGLRWLVRKQVQHVATETTALEALRTATEASNVK